MVKSNYDVRVSPVETVVPRRYPRGEWPSTLCQSRRLDSNTKRVVVDSVFRSDPPVWVDAPASMYKLDVQIYTGVDMRPVEPIVRSSLDLADAVSSIID